jgi:acyl-CoA-binding protein
VNPPSTRLDLDLKPMYRSGMALDEDFSAAQSRVKTLSKTPSADKLLSLYSLYKQASVGDVTGSRPGAINFKARAKYDAWAERKGMDADAAKQAYVDLVEQLVSELS